MAKAGRKTTLPKSVVQAKSPDIENTVCDEAEPRLLAPDAARAPDGARAFDLVADMEDDLFHIRSLISALQLVAREIDDDDVLSEGLYSIADAVRLYVNKADAARCEAFHLTHGYKFPRSK